MTFFILWNTKEYILKKVFVYTLLKVMFIVGIFGSRKNIYGTFPLHCLFFLASTVLWRTITYTCTHNISIYLSIYLVYLVCLSVCLSVWMDIKQTFFQNIFVP